MSKRKHWKDEQDRDIRLEFMVKHIMKQINELNKKNKQIKKEMVK